ncbi:MAG TPA: TetR/AcrR family transcriptional regulator [Mycobacterium sp.]|jgi:AcrR family transcriptional regulator
MGNRDDLLEAAIVCLRERGFGGTRARDLASTAGVSLGAIRYHFGSTEGLLNEAIAESSRRWIQSSMTNAATGLEVATDLYRVFDENRALFVGFVEAFAHAQRSASARSQLAELYDEFRRAIAAVLPDGPHTESVASVVIALVDGLMLQWLLVPDRCPPPEVVRRALTALAGLR